MKIKTNNVPADCDYLANGKEYDFSYAVGETGFIEFDDGQHGFVRITGSHHLNGASWEIVSE